MVQTQFGLQIQNVRSYNGLEFLNGHLQTSFLKREKFMKHLVWMHYNKTIVPNIKIVIFLMWLEH